MRVGSRWIALAFVACGGGPTKPPVGATAPASAPHADADVVTLRALQNGDRACYVVFETASGQQKTKEGAFELCEGADDDASALVGQRVRFTRKRDNGLPIECRGAPDCGKTQKVDLIITIAPAR